MKKYESLLKEYARKLSDDDLGWLYIRFKQNLCGDRADIANFLSRDNSIDRWLTVASPDEWFDRVEQIGEAVKAEKNRREE